MFNSRKKSLKKYSKKRKSTKKCVVSSCVKKYVNKALHKNIENKAQSYTTGYSIGSYANSNSLYARPITPGAGFLSIVQGTGQGDRIGNKVKVMKAMFRYVINANPYDASSNSIPIPMEVQMIFGFVKQLPNTTPSSANVSQLFQSGSTALAPVGDLRDLIQPYNTDYWTIKKVIKHKIGTSINDGTGGLANRAYLANNDYSFNVCRSIDITSIYPKNLIFADNSTGPQNNSLYFMCQAVAADGTVQTTFNLPTRINWTIDISYEDA